MSDSNEKWNKHLLEGEKLLWTGRPSEVKLLDTSNKGMTFLLWAVGAIWIILSFVLYIPRAAAIGNTGVQLVIVMLVMDCIPLLMIMMPISDAKNLSSYTEYAVTSQRILMQNKDKMITMPAGPGTAVEVRRRGNGTGHVLLGDAVGKPDKRLRSIALQGLDQDRMYTGMVLYHIADPEKAAACLPGHQRR